MCHSQGKFTVIEVGTAEPETKHRIITTLRQHFFQILDHTHADSLFQVYVTVGAKAWRAQTIKPEIRLTQRSHPLGYSRRNHHLVASGNIKPVSINFHQATALNHDVGLGQSGQGM